MKSGLLQFIKRAFTREPDLHPVERGMARRWVKQRLVAVFPELRNNPTALEHAYQTLDLTVRDGAEEGEPGIVYVMRPPVGEN
jgi:hypothetical protein